MTEEIENYSDRHVKDICAKIEDFSADLIRSMEDMGNTSIGIKDELCIPTEEQVAYLEEEVRCAELAIEFAKMSIETMKVVMEDHNRPNLVSAADVFNSKSNYLDGKYALICKYEALMRTIKDRLNSSSRQQEKELLREQFPSSYIESV